jgi:hypothetical protein
MIDRWSQFLEEGAHGDVLEHSNAHDVDEGTVSPGPNKEDRHKRGMIVMPLGESVFKEA